MFMSDDGTFKEECSLNQWQMTLHEAIEKVGKRFLVAPEHKKRVEDAGFENVVDDIYKVRLFQLLAKPTLKGDGINVTLRRS